MAVINRNKGVLEDRSASRRGAFVFLFVVLTGMAFIVLAKSTGLSQLQVTAIPIVIMLGYAIGMLIPALRLRDDQSGDNLYYMGLLFTLTSMGISLYQFTIEREAESIVTNFGIAIASTIVGLALRVTFNQMRQDPAEVERAARLELADASRRMRWELDNTVLELNHFRRGLLQSHSEGFEAQQAAVTEMLSAFSSSLSNLSSSLEDSLSKQARDVASCVKDFEDNVKAVSASLRGVGSQLEEMKTPDNLIEINLSPAVRALEEAVNSVRTTQEEFAARLAPVVGSTAASAEAASKIVSSAQEIASELRGNSARLAEIHRSQESARQDVSGIRNDLSQVSELQHAVRATQEMVAGVQKEVAQMAEERGSSGYEHRSSYLGRLWHRRES